MTLGDRLKALRQSLGLSQEAMGAQGFVSTPAWIKLENGQRQPSEKLIDRLVRWLVADKHLLAKGSAALREELLTLKYLGNTSPFVREMAKKHAATLPSGAALLAVTPTAKPKRGRPARMVA